MAFDREFVAETVYCEASSASPEERRLVVHVMMNRVKDPRGRFGKTMAAVCLHRKQFSEWNDDPVNNANLLRGANAEDDDPIMLDCIRAFYEARSAAFDPTHGSTHYHDKTIAPPDWAVTATLELTTDKFYFYSHVQ